MQIRHLLLAAIPLASLALAPFGGATALTIAAYLSATGASQNAFVLDCNHVINGQRAQIEARSRAADSCGNIISDVGPNQNTPDSVTSTAGTTVQSQFESSLFSGPCGAITQHAARVQSFLFDGSQQHLWNDTSYGYSGCWTTNNNTGACIGGSPVVTISSSL